MTTNALAVVIENIKSGMQEEKYVPDGDWVTIMYLFSAKIHDIVIS